MDFIPFDSEQIIKEIEERKAIWPETELGAFRYAGQSSRFRTSIQGFFNSILNVRISDSTDIEKIIMREQRNLRVSPKNIESLRRLAQAYLERGEENKAIEATVRMIDIKYEGYTYEEPPPHRTWTYRHQFKKSSRKDTLAHVIDQLSTGGVYQATYSLDQIFFEGTQPTPEFYFLRAALFEIAGVLYSADNFYEEAIYQKQSESGMPLEFYNESRNKVYTVRWNDFPGGLLFVKEYSDKRKKNVEWANSQLFRQIIGECIQKTVVTTVSDSHRGFYRAAGDRTLDQELGQVSRRRALTLLKLSAEILAHIHAFGTKVFYKGEPLEGKTDIEIIDPIRTQREYFLSKLINTFLKYGPEGERPELSDPETERLVAAYTIINKELANTSRDFYKDHNPRNIVVDENRRLTAIDFETAIMMPCQIDLVSLLEFGRNYVTPKQRIKIIETYVLRKEKLTRKKIDRGLFFFNNSYAQVHRHLELAGYRARDGELDMRSYHLSRAVHTLQILRKRDAHSNNAPALAEIHDIVNRLYKTESKQLESKR